MASRCLDKELALAGHRLSEHYDDNVCDVLEVLSRDEGRILAVGKLAMIKPLFTNENDIGRKLELYERKGCRTADIIIGKYAYIAHLFQESKCTGRKRYIVHDIVNPNATAVCGAVVLADLDDRSRLITLSVAEHDIKIRSSRRRENTYPPERTPNNKESRLRSGGTVAAGPLRTAKTKMLMKSHDGPDISFNVLVDWSLDMDVRARVFSVHLGQRTDRVYKATYVDYSTIVKTEFDQAIRVLVHEALDGEHDPNERKKKMLSMIPPALLDQGQGILGKMVFEQPQCSAVVLLQKGNATTTCNIRGVDGIVGRILPVQLTDDLQLVVLFTSSPSLSLQQTIVETCEGKVTLLHKSNKLHRLPLTIW